MTLLCVLLALWQAPSAAVAFHGRAGDVLTFAVALSEPSWMAGITLRTPTGLWSTFELPGARVLNVRVELGGIPVTFWPLRRQSVVLSADDRDRRVMPGQTAEVEITLVGGALRYGSTLVASRSRIATSSAGLTFRRFSTN